MAKAEQFITYNLPSQKGSSKGRLRPRHQDEIKAKIQATQILKIIQSHVLEGTEIAQSRIHAGLKLLDKVMANAIAPSIEANQQAQAIQAISAAQMQLLAREYLIGQGSTIEQSKDSTQSITVDIDSVESNYQAPSCDSQTVGITPSEELG